MHLAEINLTDKEITALKKKKITSVEALLRKPPLHYYDFSRFYALDTSNSHTAEALSIGRPFAIYGECKGFDSGYGNTSAAIKLRFEDQMTKTEHHAGTTLHANFMGYDQFRMCFLSQHPDSPHNNIPVVPDNVVAVLTPEEDSVNKPCKKAIDFINGLAKPDIKDYMGVKTGGRDSWSSSNKMQLITYIGEDAHRFISANTHNDIQLVNAMKWYARGLRIDLAVTKTLLDDESLLRTMLIGHKFIVGGFIRYNEEYGTFSVLNPPVISEDTEKFKTYYLQYGSVKGLTEERYRKAIEDGISKTSSLDFIPYETLKSMGLPSIKETAKMMHHPKTFRDTKLAKERGVFDDLLYLALRLKLSDRGIEEQGVIMKNYDLLNAYVKSLPFPLTGDQKKAVNAVCKSFAAGKCANALVQGDVGTGKTAVAFCLLLIAVASGYQAALTAPYITLAMQHYRDMLEIAENLGINVVMLSSDLKEKERRKVLEQIKSGEAQVIIGTHSIFGNAVEYKNLALIITDEEQKFGTVHRESFREKAMEGYHQITMSATPIPKSLAATIYGESTEVISILEKPAMRIPVQTAVCKSDVTAMEFIVKQVKEGHQAYVVCPSIENTSKEEKEDKNKVPSIKEKEAIYKSFLEPYGISLAVITGKQKADEKKQIMEAYGRGEIDILMATTVIEVGINNPNATVIVITGAERFGFSTLHQLRGRVGRGKFKSYCILQSDDIDANEKLQFMCTTCDGFKIAEKDLELRGPGSLFGEKQSGDNYYISLMMANQELYKKIKILAKKLCEDGTGAEIVKRYEEIFLSEEER